MVAQSLNLGWNPAALLDSASTSTRSSFRCRAAAVASPLQRKTKAGSLYEVLRVNHNASPLEIKAAYRTLAKLYHPDAAFSSLSRSQSQSQSQSDGCDFIEIHNAYETLSDPAARALYDLSLGLGFGGFGGPSDIRLTSSFHRYSSVGRRPTRRWETDQCW